MDNPYPLVEIVAGQIWVKEYPIHYAGCHLHARMTIIRLQNGTLMLHSPCDIDTQTKAQITQLGEVAFIVAPGSYHYFYITSAQRTFDTAQTFICPGIAQKLPDLAFEGFLSDHPDPRWADDFDQVLVRGNRFMCEIAFCHKPSGTLILVDLIENITAQTPDTNLILKLWWKGVFHMWNAPKPAPEYQLGWKDKAAARRSLERILDLEFDRIILAHGDLIERDGQAFARRAWRVPLAFNAS